MAGLVLLIVLRRRRTG
ncbi:hypothetical protein ACH4TS_25065 [Streptomyces albidoflavus]